MIATPDQSPAQFYERMCFASLTAAAEAEARYRAHNARLRRMLYAASAVIAAQWAVIAYLIVRPL